LWRNAIGAEGTYRVKELLVSSFIQLGAVNVFVTHGGVRVPSDQGPPPVSDLRAVITASDYQVIFGSEPDISIRDPQGILHATIEVKYGLDEAGALERYGAAKKSFERAARENPRVTNIYLAACITPEVKRRIDADRLVNKVFDLAEILGDSNKRAEFLEYLQWLMQSR